MPYTRIVATATALTLLLAASAEVVSAAARPDPPDVRFTGITTGPGVTGERVEITNRSSGPVDLSGWTVRNPTHRVYALTGILGPEETVVVHSGPGVDGLPAGHRYRGSDTPLWHDTVDTAILRDAAGTTVHACPWRHGVPCLLP